MVEHAAASGVRDPYLSVNERTLAVASMEMTADLLDGAEKDLEHWPWEIIAVHNAAQSFMVLALKGTWAVTVEHRDQRTEKLQAERDFYAAIAAGDDAAAARANEIRLFGQGDLAAFKWLYERIKDPEGIMRRYVHSQEFVPREKDDQCMECLNEIRNELMHFMPQTRGYLLSRFAAINETALHVIGFLLNESNAIDWFQGVGEDDLEARAKAALIAAQTTLARIQADYELLAKPVPPLCGSEPWRAS
jgi:hypothetical protein